MFVSRSNCSTTSRCHLPEMSRRDRRHSSGSGDRRHSSGPGDIRGLTEQIMAGARSRSRNSPQSSSASSEGNDEAAMAVIMSLLEVQIRGLSFTYNLNLYRLMLDWEAPWTSQAFPGLCHEMTIPGSSSLPKAI